MNTDYAYFGIDGLEIPGIELAILDLFSCIERRTKKSAIKQISNSLKVTEQDASICISIAKSDQLLEHGGVQGNLKISEKGRERHAILIHWKMTRATRSVGTDTLTDILREMEGN